MALIYGAAHHPCQHTTSETSPPQNQRSHGIPLTSSLFTSSIPFIPLLTTAPLDHRTMLKQEANFSDCSKSPSIRVNRQPSRFSGSKSAVATTGWPIQEVSEVRRRDFIDEKDSACWLEPAKKRSFATVEQTSALLNLFAETRFPPTDARAKLSLELGMSTRKVQIWFQNRRQGEKILARGKGKGSGRSSISPSLPEESTEILLSSKQAAPYSETSPAHLATFPIVTRHSQRTPIPRLARPRIRRSTSPPQAIGTNVAPLLSLIPLPDRFQQSSEVVATTHHQRSTIPSPQILLNNLTVLPAPQHYVSASSQSANSTQALVPGGLVPLIDNPKGAATVLPLGPNLPLLSSNPTTLPPLLKYLSEGANPQLFSFLAPISPVATIVKTETSRSTFNCDKLSELAELGIHSVRWWH